MRRIFHQIHLWLSIPFGIIITVICLSGAALVFETEITHALHPHLYRVEYTKGQQQMPPSALVQAIMQQVPDSLRLTSLQYSGKPDETCLVTFSNVKRKTLSINPYTGEVNGWIEGNTFFQQMRRLHRWLLDSPEQKGQMSAGKMIVGISTIIMVIVTVSGIVIWVPRKRSSLKSRLCISAGKGWRRFWYDCHVATGIYAAIFILIMALTGLTWSFGWYRTAAYSLMEGTQQQTSAPAAEPSQQQERKQEKGRKGKFDYNVWDNALAQINGRYTGYKSVKLTRDNILVSPDPNSMMRKNDTATFDKQTGDITGISLYKDTPRAQKLKGWFFAFHTGTWGGITTKVIYFLAAVIGGILPLSGYYLWIKRKRAKNKRQRS